LAKPNKKSLQIKTFIVEFSIELRYYSQRVYKYL
jgi:hypothetical protein